MSASDRQWPRKHTELACSPAPLQGPPPGLPRPRPGRATGAALGAGSGTDLGAKPRAMSATGPHRSPACPLFAGRKWAPGPVAGFARPPKGPPASGTALAIASLQVPAHVTPAPKGHSSRLARHVRDPSGGGSDGMMARAAEGVEKIAGYFGYTIGIVWAWARFCAREDAGFCGTRSPPLRGRCLRSRQRGVWFHLFRAYVFWRGSPPLSPTVTSPPQGGRSGGCPDRLGCQQNRPDGVFTFRHWPEGLRKNGPST